jgi:Arm DNA-binding domain/Phage integrase, N-terminal SAM-like domain
MGRSAGVVLNKSAIENMRPKATVFRVPDAQTRGLYLQMTPAGVLSWVIRYRLHGHQKTHSLGRWPELTVALARKKALSLLAGIGDGNDPATKRKEERKAETVAELAKRFQKEHLPTLKKSTRDEYDRLLRKRILPALGSMRAKDVDPSDVGRLLSQIRADTPSGAFDLVDRIQHKDRHERPRRRRTGTCRTWNSWPWVWR